MCYIILYINAPVLLIIIHFIFNMSDLALLRECVTVIYIHTEIVFVAKQ